MAAAAVLARRNTEALLFGHAVSGLSVATVALLLFVCGVGGGGAGGGPSWQLSVMFCVGMGLGLPAALVLGVRELARIDRVLRAVVRCAAALWVRCRLRFPPKSEERAAAVSACLDSWLGSALFFGIAFLVIGPMVFWVTSMRLWFLFYPALMLVLPLAVQLYVRSADRAILAAFRRARAWLNHQMSFEAADGGADPQRVPPLASVPVPADRGPQRRQQPPRASRLIPPSPETEDDWLPSGLFTALGMVCITAGLVHIFTSGPGSVLPSLLGMLCGIAVMGAPTLLAAALEPLRRACLWISRQHRRYTPAQWGMGNYPPIGWSMVVVQAVVVWALCVVSPWRPETAVHVIEFWMMMVWFPGSLVLLTLFGPDIEHLLPWPSRRTAPQSAAAPAAAGGEAAVPHARTQPGAYAAWVRRQLADIFARVAARERTLRERPPGLAGTDLLLDLDRHPERLDRVMLLGLMGLIAAGKTTLCTNLTGAFKRLAGGKGVHVPMYEHVNDLWLEAFYADPKGMATKFQNHQCQNCLRTSREAVIRAVLYDATLPANLDRLEGPEGGAPFHSVVVDRSPLGNLCFALLHVSLGNISLPDFELYKEVLAEAGRSLLLPQLLYLETDPAVVHRRVQSRGDEDGSRACEQGDEGVSLDYLCLLRLTMASVFGYVEKGWPERCLRVNWNDFGDHDQLARTLIQRAAEARLARAEGPGTVGA